MRPRRKAESGKAEIVEQKLKTETLTSRDQRSEARGQRSERQKLKTETLKS
jgi:hypothetical protein